MVVGLDVRADAKRVEIACRSRCDVAAELARARTKVDVLAKALGREVVISNRLPLIR